MKRGEAHLTHECQLGSGGLTSGSSGVGARNGGRR